MEAGRRPRVVTVGTAQVLVVMGVSGSGKSTLGQLLADRLGWDFLEGDDLHPVANVAKMAAGIPLDDADREPWLAAIAAWIEDYLSRGRSGVVACSALRRSYRDVLRGPEPQSDLWFVELSAPAAVLAARIASRHGHFMPTSLLESQLATLEPLEADEQGIIIDATEPTDGQADQVLSAIPGLRP